MGDAFLVQEAPRIETNKIVPLVHMQHVNEDKLASVRKKYKSDLHFVDGVGFFVQGRGANKNKEE